MAKLYLISPPQINLPEFSRELELALAPNLVSAFQLRLKDVPENEILAAAKILMPVCRKAGVPFIINDSVEIAAKCGADGVHLGGDDGDVKQAREKLGANVVIGASCYNSIDFAISAAQSGADYVSFGAFYPTTTKVAKSKAELETLKKWSMATNVPCSAIGGITPQNAAPLVKAGADFICVISYVWNHPASPAKAVEEFRKSLDGQA